MCTVPSPVLHFWQSLIFWPCSALIKCSFPNTVGRFSGFTPISEAVSYTEECTHRPALRPGPVGSALTSRIYSRDTALSCQCTLPSPGSSCALHVISSDLKSSSWGTTPNQYFREGLFVTESVAQLVDQWLQNIKHLLTS